MKTRHVLAPIATACLLASGAAILTPASASVAAAAAGADSTCTVRVLTTRAVNLQHDQKEVDVVRARLGNTLTRQRSYVLGQTRNTNVDGEEVFTGPTRISLEIQVREVAWIPIDSRNVDCEDASRTFTLRNGDATYKARVVVRVL